MTVPYVWICPGRMSGAPCIGGTRVPTEQIAALVRYGESIGDMCKDYDITRGDILVACWYETGRHPRAAAWASWREWAAVWPHTTADPPVVASDGTVDG